MVIKKKTAYRETPWTGLPDNFNVEDYAGFCYLITNTLTLQKYIGKKFFWSKRKIKVKGQKRRKLVTKESDWKLYKSSSDYVKAAIKQCGIENFEFLILSVHKTRAETNYTEVKEMFKRDVLYSRLNANTYEYLNECILNRYYRKKELTGLEE